MMGWVSMYYLVRLPDSQILLSLVHAELEQDATHGAGPTITATKLNQLQFTPTIYSSSHQIPRLDQDGFQGQASIDEMGDSSEDDGGSERNVPQKWRYTCCRGDLGASA
jgi:hypothetical protein